MNSKSDGCLSESGEKQISQYFQVLTYLREERGGMLFGHGLHLDEAGVVAVEREELVVGAAFDDASFVEHTYLGCVLDGREAVGYDQCRAVLHESVEGLLH